MKGYDPTTASGIFPVDAWESSFSCGPNGGNCVEVNLGADGLVGLRDSKLAQGPVLVFDDAEWTAFLNAAVAGQFNR